MNDEVVVVQQQTVQDVRAHAVKNELESLQDKTENNVFDLCDLLLEAKTNSYHMSFGFARFNDWVEFTPSLDLSARQASYYINIADKALKLEVDRPTLKRVKLTKLREIFSLDETIFRAEMLALLEDAEAMSIDEVKAKVRALKAGAGEEVMLFMTIKYPESAKAVIDIAFEKYRRLIGTLPDKYGEQVEPPNGTVLERMCADVASGPDYVEEFDYAKVTGDYDLEESPTGISFVVDMHEEVVSA